MPLELIAQSSQLTGPRSFPIGILEKYFYFRPCAISKCPMAFPKEPLLLDEPFLLNCSCKKPKLLIKKFRTYETDCAFLQPCGNSCM